jgi:NAD(P)-dependent dehydrogenase (short-subunit alcohol dehydrogenase family)
MVEQRRPTPPQPEQKQEPPGFTSRMDPIPDHGERSYKGTGRLANKVALITGADSGIGKAVAIAFAREGADILISYLNEHEDARDTAKWVEEAGRKALVVAGDISSEDHCKSLIDQAANELGGLDILVNNAAFQRTYADIADITADE